MKVVAFSGSPRRDGNTAILVRHVFEELEKEGIETELIQLAGKRLQGCLGCYKCWQNLDQRCGQTGDEMNDYFGKMLQADGIILASPVYYADVTAGAKALMERAGFVSKANGDLLRRKVGAAVIAVRRGGQIHAFDTLNHFFLISQMIVPGASYWNFAFGIEPGEVEKDREGLRTMHTLGENMAWLLKKIHS
jgi:multimeric flavodoxin WrbA